MDAQNPNEYLEVAALAFIVEEPCEEMAASTALQLALRPPPWPPLPPAAAAPPRRST